ncbi:unnamed protein product, partial [Larinioides sclopetarius]
MVISQSLTLISFIHSEIAISRVEQRCHQMKERTVFIFSLITFLLLSKLLDRLWY